MGFLAKEPRHGDNPEHFRMPGPTPDALPLIDFGNPAQPLPPTIGPFKVRGRIGSGGMGVVLDALDDSGQRVALKIIRPLGNAEHCQMLAARLLREARILKQLDHPGVVKLLDYGSFDGMVCLAMERIEGVTLEDVRTRTSVSASILVSLAAQLLETIAALHEVGVVHRDIKPGNVLIDRRGRTILTDFGISWVQEGTGITRAGQVLGTAGYIAPECLEGQRATPLSDLYALGRLLFELAALRPPQRLEPGTPLLVQFALRLEVDWSRFPSAPPWPGVAQIIRRMVAKDPKDRYSDAKACLRAMTEFEALVSGESDRGVAAKNAGSGGSFSTPVGNPTVFVPANTLNRFVEGLKLRPRLPWEPRSPSGAEGFVGLAPEDGEGALASVRKMASPRDGELSSRPANTEGGPPDDEAGRQIARAPEARIARPKGGRGLLSAIALVFLVSGAILASRFGAVARTWFLPRAPAPSTYVYRGEAAPGPKQISISRMMLEAALEELRRGSFDRAEQLLSQCIELSGLAECHAKVAQVMFLVGDARGETHSKWAETSSVARTPE